MLIPRFRVWILPVGLTLFGAAAVCGQDYPSKPIRIITAPTGGGGDVAVRQIAPGISGPVCQSMIVDNRGGGIAPAEAACKASPDGYTLLVGGAGFWNAPLTHKP